MKRNRLLLTLPLIFLLSSCGNDVISSSSSDYSSTTETSSTTTETTTSSSDEKIPYSITHDVSDDYQINGLSSSYFANDIVSFSITLLNAQIEITEVKANDDILSIYGENMYSFTMPNEDVHIYVLTKNKEDVILNSTYSIKYDMGDRSTSYAFKDGENETLLNTFSLVKGEKLINSVSSFTKIYGGGYGGSGDNKWIKGDMLKFGTTSVNGEILLTLNQPISKIKISGYASSTSGKIRIGDATSLDWTAGSDNKTALITTSNFTVASKESTDANNVSSAEIEFEATTNLKIATTNTKPFYLTDIEFVLSDDQYFNVTWCNDDGSILEKDENVLFNTYPIYNGATPTKSDGDTNYIFIGWTPEIEVVTKDATYVATYIHVDETVTITWKNYDGTILEVDEYVKIGDIPTYDGETPSKESEGEKQFVFSGWSPNITPASVDQEYIATFEEAKLEDIKGVLPTKTGGYIEYGLYPQSHVKDETIISKLDQLQPTSINNWYLYNNEFYEKVTASVYNNETYTFNDSTNIENGKTYYFKCEPIRWKILENNSNEYFLLSDVLLSSYQYFDNYDNRMINNEIISPNNYKESSIRNYLNNDFLNKAFAISQDNILTTLVDNSGLSQDIANSQYKSENTNDKIFLLSYQDYLNTSYGFESTNVTTQKRVAKTSEYARATGAWSSKDASSLYAGSYWTRSPVNDLYYASYNVNSGGYISKYAVDGNSHSIRPALKINL